MSPQEIIYIRQYEVGPYGGEKKFFDTAEEAADEVTRLLHITEDTQDHFQRHAYVIVISVERPKP